jgi:hypothetical protein
LYKKVVHVKLFSDFLSYYIWMPYLCLRLDLCLFFAYPNNLPVLIRQFTQKCQCRVGLLSPETPRKFWIYLQIVGQYQYIQVALRNVTLYMIIKPYTEKRYHC